MNIARFVMIAVPVGVVIIYLLMQSLTVGESPTRELVARGELMGEIEKRSFAGIYDAIQKGFPEEYAIHVKEIEEIALDTDLTTFELGPELMAESDAFVEALRRENARHLPMAGRDPLLNILRAHLAILKEQQETPELCVRVARDGLDTLDRFEIARIEPKLRGRWVLATIEALIAGRDAPETFLPPTDNDWGQFLRGWRDEEGGMTPSMEAYLLGDATDPALYCEGAIAFTRRLIADTTPSGLRILVDYTGNLAS